MLAVFNSAGFKTASGVAVAANATVEVRRMSDSGLASIFSDEAGTNPITNPSAFADSEGRFAFYAAGLARGYSVKVTKDAETHTIYNVAIGTAGQMDIEDFSAGPTLVAEQATTSGSQKDFTGIPAGVRRITVHFNGCSMSGSAIPKLRIGDSGGVETSGYVSSVANINGGTTSSTADVTDCFALTAVGNANNALIGTAVLTRINASHLWMCVVNLIVLQGGAGTIVAVGAGTKTLSAELDRVQFIVSGNTMDAGAISLTYE